MLRVGETLNHGMGVFATQSTPVGTLLWREKPLVKLDMEEVARETERMMAARNKGEDGMATATRVVQLCQVIDSFNALTKEEKQSFFRLKDTFDYLSDPDAFPVDVNTIDVAIFKEIISMSREVAARVWGIFNTNQLQGYLALGISNVNHACGPNCEVVWNPEENSLDIRSTVFVEEGEEVTVNYLSVTDGLNLSVRQRALQRIYG